jgi:hypothetical protein
MYKSTYIVERTKTESKDIPSTQLYVKFRFRGEVAPVNRKKVRDSISFWPLQNGAGLLHKYFTQVEKLIYNRKDSTANNVRFKDSKRSVQVSHPKGYKSVGWFTIGFDISVQASGEVPLEEMLNLDSLNKTILRGEIQKQEEQ